MISKQAGSSALINIQRTTVLLINKTGDYRTQEKASRVGNDFNRFGDCSAQRPLLGIGAATPVSGTIARKFSC